MTGPTNDNALSEIIGFILILVVIIVAFSIYLIYAVPAQGREDEILHMNDIRDKFVAYKIGVDALWTNNQIGTSMGMSFPLGTQSSSTGGFLSFIPIMSPVASGGALALNQRQETLTVESEGLTYDGRSTSNQTLASGSFPLNATPQQFLVTISDTFDTEPSDYLSARKRSVLVKGEEWSVNVTVIPRILLYYPNSTDITLDVMKNGNFSLQGVTVYQDIKSNVPYTINLLDDAYGLKNYLAAQPYPMTVTLIKYGSLTYGSSDVTFFDDYDHIVSHSTALGALEYLSNNNYWLQQSYYYQDGGVFLRQDEGTVVKLPPAITFSYDRATGITGVKLVELPYLSTGSNAIGGNSAVQVKTKVTDIGNLSYSLTYANTKWINISIAASDYNTAKAWSQYLNDAANISGGVPTDYYYAPDNPAGNQAFINIRGTDQTGPSYDIHVGGIRANLSATIQGG